MRINTKFQEIHVPKTYKYLDETKRIVRSESPRQMSKCPALSKESLPLDQKNGCRQTKEQLPEIKRVVVLKYTEDSKSNRVKTTQKIVLFAFQLSV